MLKFVAWQVEHAVVIQATTRSTCNATMLHDKLNGSVAHITCLKYFKKIEHKEVQFLQQW